MKQHFICDDFRFTWSFTFENGTIRAAVNDRIDDGGKCFQLIEIDSSQAQNRRSSRLCSATSRQRLGTAWRSKPVGCWTKSKKSSTRNATSWWVSVISEIKVSRELFDASRKFRIGMSLEFSWWKTPHKLQRSLLVKCTWWEKQNFSRRIMNEPFIIVIIGFHISVHCIESDGCMRSEGNFLFISSHSSVDRYQNEKKIVGNHISMSSRPRQKRKSSKNTSFSFRQRANRFSFSNSILISSDCQSSIPDPINASCNVMRRAEKRAASQWKEAPSVKKRNSRIPISNWYQHQWHFPPFAYVYFSIFTGIDE